MPDEYPEKLEFCYWGNPILRKKAVTVENPDSEDTAEFIRKMRKEKKIRPVYKLVDTCAAEFEAYTPYFYSTYEMEDEA